MDVAFGAHHPIEPGGDQLEAIQVWEQAVGMRNSIPVSYRRWSGEAGQFTSASISLRQSVRDGRTPMVTWEPMEADGSAGRYSVDAIARGDHDRYILEWAHGLRDLGSTVYLRPMHEFNLHPKHAPAGQSWYPWASAEPREWVQAWWHIRNLFAAAGALRTVKMIWCMNRSDQPLGNYAERWWPGASGVDVLGLDAYPYSGWRDFGDLIRNPYERLVAKHPTAPVFVCETATAEPDPRMLNSEGQSRAAWIAGIGEAARTMPRLAAVCWFNARGKVFDWRLESNAEAMSALRLTARALGGYHPAPLPYLPPTPDRVSVRRTEGGAVVSWRTLPGFARGCMVYVDGDLAAVTEKGETSATLRGFSGEREVVVRSYTRVQRSPESEPLVARLDRI